jgi:hypothetical protein
VIILILFLCLLPLTAQATTNIDYWPPLPYPGYGVIEYGVPIDILGGDGCPDTCDTSHIDAVGPEGGTWGSSCDVSGVPILLQCGIYDGCGLGATWSAAYNECSYDSTYGYPSCDAVPDDPWCGQDGPDPDPAPYHGPGTAGRYLWYPACFATCADECTSESWDTGHQIYSRGILFLDVSTSCGSPYTKIPGPACMCEEYSNPLR